MNTISEIFSQLPPPFNMIVLVVAFGCGTQVLGALFKQVRLFADHEADRRFKRDLVDSGLSVEETERIAAAKVTKRQGAA